MQQVFTICSMLYQCTADLKYFQVLLYCTCTTRTPVYNVIDVLVVLSNHFGFQGNC